jgi:gas vesicle protein
MGKFVFGLIIGVVVGVVAMSTNPNLAEELRVSLANLTAQVMRSAGQTADELGNAAEDAADEPAPPAATEPPAETAPTAPADATPPANQGETRQPQ